MFVLPVSRSLVARNGANVWRDVDRLVNDFFSTPEAKAVSRAPALDVEETPTSYVATLDLPGVAKEQVKVTIEGKRVHIEAEVNRSEEKKDGDRVIYRERSQVKFERSFVVRTPIKEAHAKLENGVLELTLEKQPTEIAKQITVN